MSFSQSEAARRDPARARELRDEKADGAAEEEVDKCGCGGKTGNTSRKTAMQG